MATLTQTAYYSRKIIKYGSIAIVALLILRSLFISFTTYWKKTHPPALPKPTFLFGKLPKLKFPLKNNLPPIEFRLETITGNLPKLPEQAKVFAIPRLSRGILALENTKQWANSIGFDQQPQELGNNDYRFTSSTLPKTTLDVNIVNRNFHLVYNWQEDLNITSQTAPPLDNQAISATKAFLQQATALTPNIDEGSTEVIYLKYTNNGLTKALFAAEANLIKVNLFRKEINNLKVLPPNPKDSNITSLLSSSYSQLGGIIDLKYNYENISEEKFATYALKDVNLAWSQLNQGKGFIANLGNNPDGKIVVRNASLAYYDSDEQQDFLQPIIVFEGDNEFYAYVPAIIDEYVEQ